MGLFIYSIIQMRLQNSLLRAPPCDDAPSFVMRWLHFLLPANRHWKSGNTSLPKVRANWDCTRQITSFSTKGFSKALLTKSSRSVLLRRPGVCHISFILLSRRSRSQTLFFWELQSSMITRNSFTVKTISSPSSIVVPGCTDWIWIFIAITPLMKPNLVLLIIVLCYWIYARNPK